MGELGGCPRARSPDRAELGCSSGSPALKRPPSSSPSSSGSVPRPLHARPLSSGNRRRSWESLWPCYHNILQVGSPGGKANPRPSRRARHTCLYSSRPLFRFTPPGVEVAGIRANSGSPPKAKETGGNPPPARHTRHEVLSGVCAPEPFRELERARRLAPGPRGAGAFGPPWRCQHRIMDESHWSPVVQTGPVPWFSTGGSLTPGQLATSGDSLTREGADGLRGLRPGRLLKALQSTEEPHPTGHYPTLAAPGLRSPVIPLCDSTSKAQLEHKTHFYHIPVSPGLVKLKGHVMCLDQRRISASSGPVSRESHLTMF